MGAAALAVPGRAAAQQLSGFYAGAHTGVTLAASDTATSTVFSTSGYFATSSVPAIAAAGGQHLRPRAAPVGGYAGVNLSFGRFVLGFEGDVAVLRAKQTAATTAPYPCCAGTGFTITQSVRAGRLATLRPRLGIGDDRWVVYGTLGVAYTRTEYEAIFTDTFASAHETGAATQGRLGPVWGAGVEIGVGGRRWAVRGDFLRATFGKITAISDNLTAFKPPESYPSNVFTHRANFAISIARAGFTFRF